MNRHAESGQAHLGGLCTGQMNNQQANLHVSTPVIQPVTVQVRGAHAALGSPPACHLGGVSAVDSDAASRAFFNVRDGYKTAKPPRMRKEHGNAEDAESAEGTEKKKNKNRARS